MTGPIKPPSNHPASAPPNSQEVRPTDSRPPESGRAEFRERSVTTPDIPSQRAAVSALSDPGLRDLTDALRAGTLTPDAAVQSFVDRALASPAAATLAPAAKARLAEALRRQLVEDPAFAALIADLGRAR